MRRLLAAAATVALFAIPATAHAAYSRECGGVVDIECRGRVCPTDCWDRDCLLWVDVQHKPNTAQCVQNIAPVN